MPEGNFKRNKKNGNDTVIQIKNNQESSFNKVKKLIANSEAVSTHYDKQNRKRNRIEYRKTEVFLTPDSLAGKDTLFEYARCFIKVHRQTDILDTKEKAWKTRLEDSYYISTVAYEAGTMAKTIRGHWSIENSNNYVRDVTLEEDYSRIRINPGVMSRLRSFALNILRANKVNNIKRTIFKNSMDLNRVLSLRGIL